MQTIDKLDLPKNVKAALIQHLQQPFQNESEAKAYWLESGTQVVIGDVPPQAIPEYTDSLPDGYTISLVITSDAGEGVYYQTKGENHGN